MCECKYVECFIFVVCTLFGLYYQANVFIYFGKLFALYFYNIIMVLLEACMFVRDVTWLYTKVNGTHQMNKENEKQNRM